MYKARLKNMRNALTKYSKHRKMKQLWLHRTPTFSCCTPDLTHPTQLHAPYTLCTSNKMPLYWSGWHKERSLATPLLLQWIVLQPTLSCHHVFWNITTIAPILCRTIVDSEQIRQMRYSHHSELSGFSVLFSEHRQHWGSSYTPTRYFHMQSSKII